VANNTLTDRSGNALDGDGDGTGGDAYVHVFDVVCPANCVFEGVNNETLATATALPLVEDPAGSGLWLGRGLGSVQPASDVDWWSFTAQAGDLVSVSVDTPGSDLSPLVYLYDAGGNTLENDYNDGPGNDAFISHRVIASSGTYYVRVRDGSSYSGGAATGS
jgi:hypothetical protein